MAAPLRKRVKNAQLVKSGEAYVAFLDILGFEKLLGQANFSETIEAIVGALQKRVVYDGKYWPSLHYLAISDTIIITANVGNGRTLVRKIGQVQNALLKQGFASRGAITFGPVLTYEGTMGRNIFGQTYVDAYLAEKNLAIYPRVVIAKSCAAKLKREIRDQTQRDLSVYILRDVDGVNFTNQFCGQLIGRSSKTLKNRRASLSDRLSFRKRISAAIQETLGDPRANMKWLWLRRHFEAQFATNEDS
jgi:hypothetical protein